MDVRFLREDERGFVWVNLRVCVGAQNNSFKKDSVGGLEDF